METKIPLKRIRVYRQHQLAMQSPCLLGEPCPVCSAHAQCREGKPCRPCRRGKRPECERAIQAEPAYTVTFRQAVALVKKGLAEFIHQRSALRLTYSKIAHLRDQSLRIDEQFLLAYVDGEERARAIIDDSTVGWSAPPAITPVPAEVIRRSQERVLYFG